MAPTLYLKMGQVNPCVNAVELACIQNTIIEMIYILYRYNDKNDVVTSLAL